MEDKSSQRMNGNSSHRRKGGCGPTVPDGILLRLAFRAYLCPQNSGRDTGRSSSRRLSTPGVLRRSLISCNRDLLRTPSCDARLIVACPTPACFRMSDKEDVHPADLTSLLPRRTLPLAWHISGTSGNSPHTLIYAAYPLRNQ